MGWASRAASSAPPCRLRQPEVKHWAWDICCGRRAGSQDSLQRDGKTQLWFQLFDTNCEKKWNKKASPVRPRRQRHVGDVWVGRAADLSLHRRVQVQSHRPAPQSGSPAQFHRDRLASPASVQQRGEAEHQQSSENLNTRTQRKKRTAARESRSIRGYLVKRQMMAMNERPELTSAMTEPPAVCWRLHALCVYMQLWVCVSARCFRYDCLWCWRYTSRSVNQITFLWSAVFCLCGACFRSTCEFTFHRLWLI